MATQRVELREISNVILTRGNSVLLGRRSPSRKSYPSCWAVPGGQIEEGESPEAAGIRELREELGVEVKSLRQLGKISTKDALGLVTFHMFASSSWEGDPEIRDGEHSELRWFDLEEAFSLDSYP